MATDGYILAIDYGDRRVGLALGHVIARLPRPLQTLENGPTLIEDIQTIAQQEQVTGLVVGLPRNMDGSLGPQAQKCHIFGEKLYEQLSLPVSFVEETLSSVEASAYMNDAQAKKAGLDAVAAARILERYFDEPESRTDGLA
jgi:putative holliday junction resolvase